MRFFTRQLWESASTDAGRLAFRDAVARYDSHKKAIRRDLDPGWRCLLDSDLHDARITKVEHRSKTSVTVTLDTTGCFSLDSETQLMALNADGTIKYWIPYSVKDEWWLTHEVDLNRDGLPVLRALLHRDEIMVEGGTIETVAA